MQAIIALTGLVLCVITVIILSRLERRSRNVTRHNQQLAALSLRDSLRHHTLPSKWTPPRPRHYVERPRPVAATTPATMPVPKTRTLELDESLADNYEVWLTLKPHTVPQITQRVL